MRIRKQDYNDVTVIQLQGQLDCDTTDQLRNTITEVIATNKIGIVLDMSDVDFIDSEGLEQLLWAKDYCDDNKAQLRLAGLDENCEQILLMTRLDSQFNRYAELAQAVKSFA